jgi:hypothetical protein
MHVATIAEIMIAVIFGFEFMILAEPFSIVIFSNNLYEQGNFSMSRRHRRGATDQCKPKIKLFFGRFFGCFSIFTDADRKGAQQ